MDAQTFLRPNELYAMNNAINAITAAATVPGQRPGRRQNVAPPVPNVANSNRIMSVGELRNLIDEIGAPRHAPPNPQQMQNNIADLLGPLQRLQANQALGEARREGDGNNLPHGQQAFNREEEVGAASGEQDVEDIEEQDEHGDPNQNEDQHQITRLEGALGIGHHHNVVVHELGQFDVTCKFCGALHWMEEKLKRSSMRSPKFGSCCLSGSIELFRHEKAPGELIKLFNGTDQL